MSWRLAAYAVVLPLCGCGSWSLQAGREEAIISSIRYDHLSCGEVLVRRNRIAVRYLLSPEFQPEPVKPSMVGLNPLIPDLRSAKVKEVDLAKGHIEAMNRSMTRRSCSKKTLAIAG